MSLNWLEESVACLYKLKGYMIIENEDLPMPKTESRTVSGHSDIDVIAIKENEIIHIECQSWWGPSKEDEKKELQRLKDRFEHTPSLIFKKYTFLNKDKFKLKNIFVTSGKPKKGRGGPWDRLQEFCNKNEIELVENFQIFKELISELRKKYPNYIVGKEKGITRFLLDLIRYGFIKDEP